MRTHRHLRAVAMALVLAAVNLHAQYGDRDSCGAPATSANAPAPGARIDINHASADELMKIPGMKRTWAQRIVRSRPYRTKLDLFNRGIVPDDVYERIKDFIIAHRDRQ